MIPGGHTPAVQATADEMPPYAQRTVGASRPRRHQGPPPGIPDGVHADDPPADLLEDHGNVGIGRWLDLDKSRLETLGSAVEIDALEEHKMIRLQGSPGKPRYYDEQWQAGLSYVWRVGGVRAGPDPGADPGRAGGRESVWPPRRTP